MGLGQAQLAAPQVALDSLKLETHSAKLSSCCSGRPEVEHGHQPRQRPMSLHRALSRWCEPSVALPVSRARENDTCRIQGNGPSLRLTGSLLLEEIGPTHNSGIQVLNFYP